MLFGSKVWVIPIGVIALSVAGCTKTHKASVSPFELGCQEMVVGPAPRAGYYEVKYVDPQTRAQRTVLSSGRIVQKGQTLGFCLNPKGDLLAVAGEETFTMAFAPPEATRFVWYYRSKEKTQFGREMDKLAAAAVTAAQVALVAGLYVGALALDAELDDCDDDHHHHGGHHRHGDDHHGERDRSKAPDRSKGK